MASSGPDVCCQQGFRYEGQPQGETKQINLLPGSTSTIHQVNAYFSYPETGHKGDDDKAVLILTDIFGLYENTQLLADAFAAEGYVAVVPDLFSGDAATFDAVRAGNFVLQSWISQHTTAQIDPIIASIIHYLRQELALKRIAGAGYCFGAKVCYLPF
jgi:dienelactone hydrolase